MGILSTGYPLTRARQIVICDPDWEEWKGTQAEFRIHRYGQLNPTQAWFLWCLDADSGSNQVSILTPETLFPPDHEAISDNLDEVSVAGTLYSLELRTAEFSDSDQAYSTVSVR